MKSRILVFSLILFSSMCMMGSDSCKVVVNVKTPPVSFVTDNSGSKDASIDVAPGQGFQLGVPYQNGKAPFKCTLANAPAWMAVDSATPGYCNVTGTVPVDATDGSFTGDLTVTDASGTSAKLSLGSKAPTPGT
jgi:hypothetical protein